MGLLRHDLSGEVHTLSGRTLIGRAPSCAVPLSEPRVSSEHAAIAWREGAWWVRDLASRNGTSLDGAPLAPGVDRRLAAGSSLQIAGVPMTLLDEAPPVPSARDLSSGALLVASGDVLLLPTEDNPLASVSPSEDGLWRFEGEETRPIRDREEVSVGGVRYRVFLPTQVAPTMAGSDLSLSFSVSSDEEHVSVDIISGARRVTLRQRTHLYLMLMLARERKAAKSPDAAERGWVQRDDLARSLRCDRTTINVQLHRLRHDLGSSGIEGASGLLEVRPRTGAVRIGTDALEIVRA